MDFLIQAFLRKLEDYRWLNYSYDRNRYTGTYTFEFRNLPPEVDANLLKLKIDVQDSVDEKGTIIMKKELIGNPKENGTNRSIEVILDRDTYAAKMNNIEPVFREYNEKRISIR